MDAETQIKNLKNMLRTFTEFCEHGNVLGYEHTASGLKLTMALHDAYLVLNDHEPIYRKAQHND